MVNDVKLGYGENPRNFSVCALLRLPKTKENFHSLRISLNVYRTTQKPLSSYLQVKIEY